MKISEFAVSNNVTAKMLRHYDEIGLLRPMSTDPQTGYRFYSEEQSKYLSWINLLKELDFSLAEIKSILSVRITTDDLLQILKMKRIEISDSLNIQLSKSMQINRLIRVIEREGFALEKKIDLISIEDRDVYEIMKSIPNMGEFYIKVNAVLSSGGNLKEMIFIRTDIHHFKHYNDTYGFEAGDRAISLFYEMLNCAASRYSKEFILARSHGDEFLLFALGDKLKAMEIAEKLIGDLESLDYEAEGLPCKIQCYIGILLAKTNRENWRNAMDFTHEAVNRARDKGPNCFTIMTYPICEPVM